MTEEITKEAQTKEAAGDQEPVEDVQATAEDNAEQEARRKKRKKRIKIGVIIGIVVILIAAAIGVFAAFWTGTLSPANAAAKYNNLEYVYEDEVTDYIDTYKSQMGYSDSSDEDWATFLASNNLTPERLRISTVNQLIADKLVQEKCNELGITADDDEIKSSIESLKESIAFGDDDTWKQTLEMYGQTEDGLYETYRLNNLKQQLFTKEVAVPTPTDDQVKSYMSVYDASLSDPELKHTYCFKISGLDEGGNLKKLGKVQDLRELMIEDGVNAENFASYVQMYSDVDELVETGGANGWSADTSEYSDKYVEQLTSLEKGDVSEVFNDGDGYAFIWVDDTYTLPTSTKKLEKLNFDKMPDSLHQYLSDVTGYYLWQQDSNTYLSDLVKNANVLIYGMPSDVSYNVDMSLASTADSATESSSGEATESTSGE